MKVIYRSLTWGYHAVVWDLSVSIDYCHGGPQCLVLYFVEIFYIVRKRKQKMLGKIFYWIENRSVENHFD